MATVKFYSEFEMNFVDTVLAGRMKYHVKLMNNCAMNPSSRMPYAASSVQTLSGLTSFSLSNECKCFSTALQC